MINMIIAAIGNEAPSGGQLSGYNQLIYDGNSMTFGTEMADPDTESYPANIFNAENSFFVSSGSSANSRKFDGDQFGWNFGVPSQTTEDMLSDYNSQIAPKYDNVTYNRNILILWGGTNDLYFNQDPTGAYDRIVSYGQGGQATGYYMVVLDIIDRKQTIWEPGYSAAQFQIDRDIVNGNIATNWQTFADKYIAISQDSNLGANGAANNATYFTGGKVHLTTFGNEYLADIVHQRLLQIP